MRRPLPEGRGSVTVGILFLVNVLNFYDRLAPGALVEPMRREFLLSDAQLGALSTLFTVFYAVAGLPLGRLADMWSRKKLLLLAIAVWSGFTALGAAAASYFWLLMTRLGVGAGQAACAPAATSWIADITPPNRRSRAMAWFMMAVPAGFMLSMVVSGPVAQAWGWRAALVVAGLPALVLIPVLAAVPAPKQVRAHGAALSPWPLLRNPVFRWIIASGALVNFALYAFSTFLPAFLTRVHGLSVASAGVWAGVASGAAGVVGALLAGVWGDRRPGANQRLRTAAFASLAAVPLTAAGLAAPGPVAALAGLAAGYTLLGTYYGLVYAAIQDLVPASLRATAMAVYFLAMYLCGASFGPLVTGRLSDMAARYAAGAGPLTDAARAAGLHYAMYVIPVSAALLAAVLWVGQAVSPARRPTPPEAGGRP